MPVSVRDARSMPSMEALLRCPPDTSMSFFEVKPDALPAETVSEWLGRTEVERAFGWSVSSSQKFFPSDQFLIDEWIDPEVSPLPKSKEYIWSSYEVDVYEGFVEGTHKRAQVALPSLIDKHELAVMIDVRQPLALLEKSFRAAVLAYRVKLKIDGPIYDGISKMNYKDVYEEYVHILHRLAAGESKKGICSKSALDEPDETRRIAYFDKMRKQIKKAVALRDGEYKLIVFRDDFDGLTTRSSIKRK